MDTTVAKGLNILELLAKAEGPVRLSAMAEQLGLQKSNVHRLLATFIELGYVAKEPESGRYALTLRLWELGSAVLAMHPAKRAAAPFMQELHHATSETVSLTVLDGDDVLYLEKIVAPRVLRFTTRPGARAPAALVAPGKALLAHEPDALAIIKRAAKQGVSGKKIDVTSLMAELEGVRRNGYSVSKSNLTPGVVGVAAPIMGRDGRAAAAVSVSGPAERLTEKKIRAVVEAVLNASARIAETVGRI
jgi:IclR family transcriptional regulator, KDG regulon repressor